jgi:8-oxo-dGTP pyrophosphatase MutT (NUDIX family)
METRENDRVYYAAAGGVVVRPDRVLVLRRPKRDEVRLPKGHIEPGESAEFAALREVCEESGLEGLSIRTDLGEQIVEFDRRGERVVRTERYFLMDVEGSATSSFGGEAQFEPEWVTWDTALTRLTFEAEREWVRRARRVSEIVD